MYNYLRTIQRGLLVTNILQMFCCVLQKKKTDTGLNRQEEGEQIKTEFAFLVELCL